MSLRTTDVDRAWAFLDPRYYRSWTRLADRTQRLDAAFDIVRLGPVTLGRATFGADVKVSIDEIDAYHVNLPCTGMQRWSRGRDDTVIAPGAAVTYQPRTRAEDRFSADCAFIGVKIEPAALQTQLAAMLDAPVTSPVRIEPRMDLTRGAAAGWGRLVRMLAADATDARALAHHPLMRDQLVETLLAGLLVSTRHRYRDRLDDGPRHRVAPRAVRRAVAAIEENPERPYTVGTLAATAGVSPRTLQAAFQDHIGTSPMRHLRNVRLARVHQDLCRPDAPTVAAVACAWGFTHLGRFAALYRARYGVDPSQNLRSGQ